MFIHFIRYAGFNDLPTVFARMSVEHNKVFFVTTFLVCVIAESWTKIVLAKPIVCLMEFWYERPELVSGWWFKITLNGASYSFC